MSFVIYYETIFMLKDHLRRFPSGRMVHESYFGERYPHRCNFFTEEESRLFLIKHNDSIMESFDKSMKFFGISSEEYSCLRDLKFYFFDTIIF